jgi:hypothetical protein
MKRLRGYFILLFTAIMLVSGWGGWWILTATLPESYFSWYPIIPLFYYLMGMLTIFDLTASTQVTEKKLLNKYMLMKLYKIAAAIVIFAVYYFAVNVKMMQFSAVFVSFYVIYLFIETYFLYMTEKTKKRQL